MNQLESLLHRYKEGTITPEEKAELDQLTRRQEVFEAASAQAAAMRRRQYAVVSTVASLLIVAGVLFTLWSPAGGASSDAPLVAQAREVQAPAAIDAPAPQQPALQATALPHPAVQPAADEPEMVQEPSPVAEPAKPAPARRKDSPVMPVTVEITEPSAVIASEPVVACNTQCSPDSVINDIWNFLKA